MNMINPLPNRWADELLRHLRSCSLCIGAKIARGPYWCRRGKELITLTLEERHGKKHEEEKNIWTSSTSPR